MTNALTLTVGANDFVIEYLTDVGGKVSHKNVIERRKSQDSAILSSLRGVTEQIQIQGVVTDLKVFPSSTLTSDPTDVGASVCTDTSLSLVGSEWQGKRVTFRILDVGDSSYKDNETFTHTIISHTSNTFTLASNAYSDGIRLGDAYTVLISDTPGINDWSYNLIRNKDWWDPEDVTLTYTESDLKNPQHSTTITYDGCVRDFKWSKPEHDPGYLVQFTFFRHKKTGDETIRVINANNNNLKLVQGGNTFYFQNIVQTTGSVNFGTMIQLPSRTTGECRVVNNLSASENLTFKGETNSLAMIVNYINNLYVTDWWTASNVELTYTDMYNNSDTFVRYVLLKSFTWDHSVKQRGVYKYTLEFGCEK